MDLTRVAEEKYIYLSTRGRRTGTLHTVELWFAIDNGRIYLSHEGAYTDWMKNILKNDHVEFRVGKNQFRGKARIVKNEETFNIGKHALYLKYYGKASEEIIDDWFSESTVIEILLLVQLILKKTVAQKLFIKENCKILIVNEPEGYRQVLGELPQKSLC